MIKTNPQYGEFADLPDYQSALELVRHANEQFNALTSRQRERFGNDPERFLAFTGDPANAEEMAKLGLMKPEALERVAAHKKAKETPKPEVKSESEKKA